MSSWRTWLGITVHRGNTGTKVVSALGGFVSLLTLTLLTKSVLGLEGASMMIASTGASAVLLFAVPHGPMSQPWSVIGGHVLSAIIGVTAWRAIGSIELAAAVAVGSAIGVMHLFHCLHPPGGATALTAVLGGSNVHLLGYGFVLRPVFLNAISMVVIAVLFHLAVPWWQYPARDSGAQVP